jgi:hypothetical protein
MLKIDRISPYFFEAQAYQESKNMETGLLEKKVSELKNSKNKDQRNTYILLAHMLKNLGGYYLASSLEDKEFAHLIGVSKPQVGRLRQNANLLLQTEVLHHGFNPKYFLDLRAAFKACGEDLPPLNFEHLLALTIDNTLATAKWDLEFRVEYPCIELSDYRRSEGVEGNIQVGSREEWNRRTASWSGFEDMALPHMIVLIYEKTSLGWLVEAIATKRNNQLDAIANSLLKLDGAEGICIHVKKTLLEPTDRISNRIREVLADQNIKQKGYVSEIAHALKRGYYVVNSSSSPEWDEVLKILKSENWLVAVETEKEHWETYRYFLPFVKLCYAKNFSDEERRRYETEGLTDKAVIESYRYLSKEQYKLSVLIPYTISSDPLFPFHEGDKVKVSLQGKSLLVTMSDEKTADNESEKT